MLSATAAHSSAPISMCQNGISPASVMKRLAAPLFEIDEAIIPVIAGFAENPFPGGDAVEALAGQLPVEQIRLLPLVAPGFDHEISRSAPDPPDLGPRLKQLPDLQIVQRGERQDKIEFAVGKGKLDRVADGQERPCLF